MAQEMPTDAGQVGPTQKTERQAYLNRMEMLRAERTTWISHWQEIGEYVFPRRFRYLYTDRNKGIKRNDKLINNTPTRACRTLGAGKMAGLSSPARPWMEFDTSGLSDEEAAWVEEVEKITYSTLARSNLYAKLHEAYETEGAFATAAFMVVEDDEKDVAGISWPIGQFMLACNAKGEIDTGAREFSMTTAQVVREFGIQNCSPYLQQKFKDGKLDDWVEVAQFIEPNLDRNTGLLDSENMPWRAVWFERGASAGTKGGPPQDYQGFLRRSGFEEFPVMPFRWYVTGEDVYGSGSPGMDCLGDSKALQLGERRKATAVDISVKPPMKGPASLRTQKLSLLPGDMNYVDEEGTKGKFEAAIQSPPQAVPNSIQVIKEHEWRIEETFFVDLFRSMQTRDDAPNGGKQPLTAREIAERHEEKMLLLGPTVESDTGTLAKLLARVVGILNRRGKLPPAPETMQGKTVKIKFTSIMAQAQKLMGIASKERAVGFIGSLSAVQPTVLDIPNFDKIVRNYFDSLGMSSDEVNTQKVVDQLRQQRAQQQAQQQQMEQLKQGADAAKVASQADLNGDNALSRLVGAAGG